MMFSFRALPRILIALGVLCAVSATTICAQTDYHDKTLGFHLGRYIALKTAGYRMVSLDVAGDIKDQRWSAVWVKQRGAPFTAIHGVSSGQLLSWYADKSKDGYRPKWITSAGSGTKRVYGCIMVKDGRKAFLYPDMSTSSFDFTTKVLSKSSTNLFGRLMVSASIHGTATNPRYAAIYEENPSQIRYGYSTNDSAASYQKKFQVFVNQVWARPAIVTMNGGQRYLSVFRGDEIGTWTAYHDMTKVTYESISSKLGKQGYRPQQIMVGGKGSAARYAALFVKGSPSMKLRVTGDYVPAFRAIDRLMLGYRSQTGFMKKTNARQAGIAITKNGCLVYARGFTYARPNWPVTQPTTGFRLASCTKPLTSMAIFQLAERRRDVSLNSLLVDLVTLGTPKDADFKKIRLHHLIDHRSGWQHRLSLGVLDKLKEAKKLVATKDLEFSPGAAFQYSNGGYMMLGLVLEAKSSQSSYLQYMKQNLLAPLGITRAHLMQTAPNLSDARCLETRWSTSRVLRVGKSYVTSGNELVNFAYAASPLRSDSSGGFVMSPVDYVRILSGVFDETVRLKTQVLSDSTRNLMKTYIKKSGRTGGWDGAKVISANGKKYTRYKKGGLYHSAHASVIRRSDGISIAAFCTGPKGPSITEINALLDKITTWPTHDLFPKYGLPTFNKKAIGSAKPFGLGCLGSNGKLTLSVSGDPEIGRTQWFRMDNGLPQSVALLLIGFSNTSWGPFRLPLDLNSFGATGCKLYTSPDIILAFPTGKRGTITVPLRHPANPLYIGLRFFTQYFCLDSKANAWGATYSNAVATLLGGWRR